MPLGSLHFTVLKNAVYGNIENNWVAPETIHNLDECIQCDWMVNLIAIWHVFYTTF